ncbi:hypothetical protein HMPREF0379_0485 [[Eubacterium] yurii subsp. margaretiae ATCC 43715]|nr:hypothetical protein HMPREF0379_0485 [[Eubacterium] yurii subsp. margaretiae ATCC 43715]
MKDEFIIYTFVNYVLLMGITLISILKKLSFYRYMEIILVTAFCINLVFFCIHKIKKVLEDVEKSSFILDVSSNEDEIKDLLRQVGNEELEQESAEQASESEEESQNIKTEGA